MTTLNRRLIIEELKDKESRHIFAAEHVNEGIPFQIHALREARGLTQKQLARKAGMAQERISVLEDPNYKFLPKIQTLLRLAEVFDVPLVVRFGSWADLLDWEINMSADALAPPVFEEDPDIEKHGDAEIQEQAITASASPFDVANTSAIQDISETPAIQPFRLIKTQATAAYQRRLPFDIPFLIFKNDSPAETNAKEPIRKDGLTFPSTKAIYRVNGF